MKLDQIELPVHHIVWLIHPAILARKTADKPAETAIRVGLKSTSPNTITHR